MHPASAMAQPHGFHYTQDVCEKIREVVEQCVHMTSLDGSARALQSDNMEVGVTHFCCNKNAPCGYGYYAIRMEPGCRDLFMQQSALLTELLVVERYDPHVYMTLLRKRILCRTIYFN